MRGDAAAPEAEADPLTNGGLTIIAQDIPTEQATGIARYGSNVLREFEKAGLPFRLLSMTWRDIRLGPVRFGYYQRIMWLRLTTRPKGVVHTMFMPVIPPATRIMTVWDVLPFRRTANNPAVARWVQRGVTRDLRMRPDVWVAITDAVRDELHSMFGVPRDRIVVARPGVDLEHFRPGIPPPPELPAGSKTTILHVGLGYRRKGIHLLVEALAQLGAERFRLVRVGPSRDAEYVAAYQARARDLGLELVECGYVPESHLPAFFANADLFVFPSQDEGAGIPPLEAMACGTNVVVSDIPAHREMCGSMATYAGRDGEALARAIEGALAHPRPSEALRRYAEGFSWAETAAVYLRLYSQFGIVPSR